MSAQLEVKTHNGYDILDEIPEGWYIDKYAGCGLHLHVFIVNGSPLKKGFKRAIFKLHKEPTPTVDITPAPPTITPEIQPKKKEDAQLGFF